MMLGNVGPLWTTMLAAMKLGMVAHPGHHAADRRRSSPTGLARGRARFIVAEASDAGKFEGLAAVPRAHRDRRPAQGMGELRATQPSSSATFAPDGPTGADDPMLLYFTSGTTARPKLVLHSHQSYPVGHLSTMFGLGLQPGDRHLNISSPGWAKHAWSSFFAPWNAGAAIVALNKRFDARATLDDLVAHDISTFCAPPTVWRHLIQHDLTQWPVKIREANSAGEPLNPEVIDQVRRAWGLTIRDSYGQTETTMMVGNSPGQPVKAGSMGRALPGYEIALVDSEGRRGEEGEICIALAADPLGLMRGYQGDERRDRSAAAILPHRRCRDPR